MSCKDIMNNHRPTFLDDGEGHHSETAQHL